MLKSLILAGLIVLGVALPLAYMNNFSNTKPEPLQHQSDIEMNNKENPHTKQIMMQCGKDAHCAMGALTEMGKGQNRTMVLATVKELISEYSRSLDNCHEEAHHLGMFVYSYARNLTEALSYGDDKCGGSSYHGIVHSFFKHSVFSKKIDPKNIDIAKLCPDQTENFSARMREECLHGIGHGLADVYNYDVLAALERCDELKQDGRPHSCASGVFMENVLSYHSRGVGKMKKDDLLFPCNTPHIKYATECYNYQAYHILYQNDYNLTASFRECDRITPEILISFCYYGMGRYLAFYSVSEAAKVSVLCKDPNVKTHYQSICFKGLVDTFIDQKDYEQAFRLCKVLPDHFKVDCYEMIGKWLHYTHIETDKRAKECSKAENSYYYETCMNAISGTKIGVKDGKLWVEP